MAVVLYCMPLEGLDSQWEKELLEKLPWEEQKRINALKNKNKKVESLYAWSLLSYLLKQEFDMDVMPCIARNAMGKPFFPECAAVHIALSHTEGAVLVGAAQRAIGLDMEKIRPIPTRVGELFGVDQSEEVFWKNWTVAESRLKLRGLGVGAVRREIEPLEKEHWENVDLFPGYTAAAAFCGEDKLIVQRICVKELYR